MMKPLQQWILGLVIALTTLLGVVAFQAQTPAQLEPEFTLESAGLTLTEIADGVYGLIASTDFPPADFAGTAICNGAIVIGSDGVLVVDPFQNEALATLLLETVATLTDQPVRYVLNTHYHFDHSGGNPAVADLPILGRGPIREFMLTRNGELDPNITPPDVIVNGDGTLWLGDRAVQLVEFDGHSGGTDLIAYIPDADVLIAGDLLFTERIPYLADGSIHVWQETLAQLADRYPTATILPGHGSVSDRTHLETFKGYLDYLETLAIGWRTAGLAEAEAVEQTPLPREYADYLFQALFPSNLAVAYQQITLEQEDAASIQQYFQAQAPELQAL